MIKLNEQKMVFTDIENDCWYPCHPKVQYIIGEMYKLCCIYVSNYDMPGHFDHSIFSFFTQSEHNPI